MVGIPNNEVTQNDLAEWYRLNDELKRLKTCEMLLRQKIFGAYFPTPTEGTNTVPLEHGWVIKGKYNITRDVDPGAFGAMRDKFIEHSVNPDKLVQFKPSLVLKEYRMLTAEQMNIFDQCLIIKPGAPALEIVLPAKAKAEQNVE